MDSGRRFLRGCCARGWLALSMALLRIAPSLGGQGPAGRTRQVGERAGIRDTAPTPVPIPPAAQEPRRHRPSLAEQPEAHAGKRRASRSFPGAGAFGGPPARPYRKGSAPGSRRAKPTSSIRKTERRRGAFPGCGAGSGGDDSGRAATWNRAPPPAPPASPALPASARLSDICDGLRARLRRAGPPYETPTCSVPPAPAAPTRRRSP
jgi:hypothetical protein